jgi:hypothetical protein
MNLSALRACVCVSVCVSYTEPIDRFQLNPFFMFADMTSNFSFVLSSFRKHVFKYRLFLRLKLYCRNVLETLPTVSDIKMATL